jgi:folate-dependent phosphoribosylglycinamide formyltransferase PurN
LQTEQPSTSNQWVAFFSQTGSEIVALSEKLGRWPNLIVTNQRPAELRTIDPRMAELPFLFVMGNKPTLAEYESLFSHLAPPEKLVVTLHGWLRVIPAEVIEEYSTIYNGHPGLITKYPELKGKDPQMKAWNLNLSSSGCVIHQVTAGVDDGPVVRFEQISIRNLTMDEMFQKLHNVSVDMWVTFLKRHWL